MRLAVYVAGKGGIMVKNMAWGVAVTLVIGLIGSYFLVLSGFIPANADTEPSRLEFWMARTSLDATLRREAPKVQNPVALTDRNLFNGVHLYALNCVVCHGSAKGNASPIAKGLYQKPPQLAIVGVEDVPEGFSFWKIKHGIRLTGMPTWRYSLSDQQIWTITLFMKHMDKLPPAVQQSWQQVRDWPDTFEKQTGQE